MIKRVVSKPDWSFLALLSILLFFGLVMVYDSSVVTAASVFGGKYHFALQQAVWIVLGFLAFGFFSMIDYSRLDNWSTGLLITSLIFLILVLLPLPFSPEIYGAKRWFYFNPAPLPLVPFFDRLGFQPTELAKLSIVVFFASSFSKRQKSYFLRFGLVLLTFLGLSALEPDFGTTLILAVTGGSLLFAAGLPLLYFAILTPIFATIGSFYILSSPYRKARFLTFIGQGSSLESSYHINQVLIALGSGGLWGLGLGESRQKYGFIPEVQTDSIFAIVGEELGLVGAVFLILLFLALIWRGFKISGSCKDSFGKYLVIGVMAWFSSQTLINLAAMTHLIPLTGVPLPLISYGGSSLVFMLAGLGIVFNVSRHKEKR